MKQQPVEEQIGSAPEVADITGIMVVLDRERFLISAGHEFQQLVDAVRDTNKAGEITIKLTVTPSGWKRGTGLPNQVDVEPKISTKIPKPNMGKSIFFLDDNNKLTRNDPDQEEMFDNNNGKR